MCLICLIFQYLWIHDILSSSSFRVDKQIVWIADSETEKMKKKFKNKFLE